MMISALGKMNNAIGDKIMKKYILSIAAFALALSCTKETPFENELTLGEGIPVTVEIGTPEEGNPNLVETKIIETAFGETHKFQWEENDAFRLLFWKNETKKGTSTLYDAGVFTTEAGGATATFTGAISADADEGEYKTWALYPASRITASSKIDKTSSAANKFGISKINLPAEQDGTGFKYCCFAATGGILYRNGDGWSFTTAPKFSMSNGIMHLRLDTELNINKITVTCDYPSTTTEFYLAGDISYATNSTGDNSQGSEKTVTVYNGGTVLSKDVYIAVRHTVSNDTYGVCHLKFAFYKADGSVAFKTLKLAKYDEDGNFKNYVNIASGNVYKIGNITSLNFKEPKTISWVADKPGARTITVPTDGTYNYSGFPFTDTGTVNNIRKFSYAYYNSGTGMYGTTDVADAPLVDNPNPGKSDLPDGKKYSGGGETVTAERYYDFWSDIDGTQKTKLCIGCYNTATGYYFYPGSPTYVRMRYAYIEIPAIAGYKLSHVYAEVVNGTPSEAVGISSVKKKESFIDGHSKISVGTGVPADVDIVSSVANTPYYFIMHGDRNLSKFTFTYIPVE